MKLKYKKIADIVSMLLIFPIVFPNSFREFSVVIFIVTGFFTFFLVNKIEKYKLGIFSISALVTMASLIKAVPYIDIRTYQWVFYVYIISPAIWLSIWTFLLRYRSTQKTINQLVTFGIIGCFSVFLLIFLFLTKGGSSVTWLIAEPNVLLKDGAISVTMHFFGSLIFIGTGIIASPQVITNKFKRIVIILLVLLIGIISGRTALFLSLGIGFLMNIFLNKKKLNFLTVASLLLIPILTTLITSVLLNNNNIDIFLIARESITKISDGGGDARHAQFFSLLKGIGESPFFGIGHGMSASVIRNSEMPWKYELLPLSTLFHVGILGFVLYLIPFFLIFLSYQNLRKKKLINQYDVFIFSGFIGILVASCTNPYLESFDFQWMIILPGVYFFNRYKTSVIAFERNYRQNQ